MHLRHVAQLLALLALLARGLGLAVRDVCTGGSPERVELQRVHRVGGKGLLRIHSGGTSLLLLLTVLLADLFRTQLCRLRWRKRLVVLRAAHRRAECGQGQPGEGVVVVLRRHPSQPEPDPVVLTLSHLKPTASYYPPDRWSSLRREIADKGPN